MGAETAANIPEDMFGLVGALLERKFRIDNLVAEGGFGVVYKGFHLTLEKPIAVKVLKTPAEYNDEARASFIEKFRLEAKALARISHPAIVQVLDFGVSMLPRGGVAPWMVLEWLTGETLEQILDARPGNGFTPPEALRLMRPVFEALTFVHDEGIAHRDVKPANIMIVRNKRGQSARLMDFGIAKLMDAEEEAGSGMTRTRTTNTSFSPQYAAPEQISGSRTGPWTDVHALGLVMCEMLTGTPAYEGSDITSIYGEALSLQRPTPLRKRANAGAWEPVLAKSLALKPDERFKTVADFLAALEASVPQSCVPALPAPIAPSPPSATKLTGSDAVWEAPNDTIPVPPGTLAGSTLPNARQVQNPGRSRTTLIGAAALGALLLVGGITWMATSGHRADGTVGAVTAPVAPTPPTAHDPVAPVANAPVASPPPVAPAANPAPAVPAANPAPPESDQPAAGNHDRASQPEPRGGVRHANTRPTQRPASSGARANNTRNSPGRPFIPLE